MGKFSMGDQEIHHLGVAELSQLIGTGALSPLDVVDALLTRIEEVNPKVLGFIEVTGTAAREEAKKAQEEIATGRKKGPLHGIPYGVKDIIDTAGVRTTNGSAIFQDNVPEEDAHSIGRLKKSGAILLGKCHAQEFASGPLSVNPFFGTVRNPWDVSRTTGGSSSGSAAAVAALMCPVALGTDTGSSIRGPSALCGLVGLKPTHGRVSLSGVCPNALSFDHVGPMTRSVEDAALILQAVAGYDEKDPYSRDVPVPDYSADLDKGIKGLRVSLCPDLYNHAGIDDEVAQAFDKSIDVFRELGAEVKVLPFAHADRFFDVIEPIRASEFLEFHMPIYEQHADKYGWVAKEAVEKRIGAVNANDLVRALRERELLRREVLKLFLEADVIVTPSLPCIAPPVDTWKATINGKEVEYGSPITSPFLTPHNFTGCPAIAVPMGFSSEGLPLSVQMVARHWEEITILRAAHAYETATPDIRSRHPAL